MQLPLLDSKVKSSISGLLPPFSLICLPDEVPSKGEVDDGTRILDQLLLWVVSPDPCTSPANGLGCATAAPWDEEEVDRPLGLGA